MAKRISETERITQFFMEADLAVAESQVLTINAILKSRRAQNETAAPTAGKARATRTKKTAAAPVESVQQSALDAATV